MTTASRATREDGSVEDISEADLYRYTRHRWVYDEAYNLSQRYLKFNLQELIRIAILATSEKGARRCTEVLKCKEGMNNRAYLLTMDNGLVVFAKLPNSAAGSTFYTAASEVATRAFLRDALDIPTPRIIVWSSQKANPVGAEYILEEAAPGQPLWSLWKDWDRVPLKARFGIIREVVEMERKLTDTKFKHCGCIYFKGDIPEGLPLALSGTIAPTNLEQFTMGPLLGGDYWRKAKSSLKLNRGPCHNALDQYLKLAPAMVSPSTPDDINAFTLWHPDLHLENVFVDPDTLQVTSVIDWQSATASPLFYQCGVPKMVQHREPVSLDLSNCPKLPDNYDDLDLDQKQYTDNILKSEQLHQYYLRRTRSDNPRHWSALQLHDELRVYPVKAVQQVWDRNTVFYLRRALMRLVENWERPCPNAGPPCPVSFNQEDIALHNLEAENREFVSAILNLFKTTFGLDPDGTVFPDKYDEIQKELERLKNSCLEAAESEEERLSAEKLWPYQDTVDQLPVVST